MPSKIFISYRRDDDPSAAARVRDGLGRKFRQGNLFIDVDNLLPGQRFDEELAKALAVSDVLIAIIGPRWMELLKTKNASGARDHVREEIGGHCGARSSSCPCGSASRAICPTFRAPKTYPKTFASLRFIRSMM